MYKYYIMSLIEKIGIENLLNSILVTEDVRPAMLVQPQDYKEVSGKDPKTKSIIERIKKYFPELLQSENYNVYQGIIISKTNYDGQEISLNRMGEILGYPCYKDFQTLDRTNTHYGITLYAVRRNGDRIQLFANVCKDQKMLENFNDIANKAEQAFKKPKYTELLRDVEITNVEVIVETIIPDQLIINKLINNEKLEHAEIKQIEDMLYNIGFSEETLLIFFFKCQYTFNPVHRGILLSLVINTRHDVIEPFIPIQNYPSQQKRINTITKEWENEVLDTLEKTKLPHPQLKKKKTRKVKPNKKMDL